MKKRPYIYTLEDVYKAESQKLFTVVSTFAGGGGSSTGYRLAGGNILAINEFVEAARQAYRTNYPSTHIFDQDIRLLTAEAVLEAINMKKGELDILDGSPPCSAFSMAGMREKGWGVEKKYSDTAQVADDLFFEFARVLKGVQPKVFIAENVKGITMGGAKNLLGSSQFDMFGNHEETIFHKLDEAGYNVRYKVLNSADYGVPQARERTIFIGVRKDIDKKISYPMTQVVHTTVREAIEDLEADDFKKLSAEQFRVWSLQNHGESMKGCGDRIGERISGVGRIKLNPDKPSNTVTTKPELWHYDEARSLAINELKRICSFPLDYYVGDKFAKKWERLGRAVPPLMMKAVAEHVYKTILKD